METVWREDISLSYITPLLDQITLVWESGGGWTVLSAKGQIYYSLIVLGEGGCKPGNRVVTIGTEDKTRGCLTRRIRPEMINKSRA